jgi:hypothetical protein
MSTAELSAIRKVFETYKQLGDKTFSQLNDDALFAVQGAEANSIAVIIQHLAGNMHSRWTDFLHSDGEKPNRNRDAEFVADTLTREQLLNIWESGWQVLFNAIDALKSEDLNRTVYIRNVQHTVHEACIRQIAHYAYHVGQIVHIAKCFSTQWNTLSIARNASDNFNRQHFSDTNPK